MKSIREGGERVMDSNVAELLKMARERAKLSQQELAKRLFIDQAIVSKVESGKLVPSYVIVKEWSKVTNAADMLGMDFVGMEGWKKLKVYEDRFERIKEIVLFFRVKSTVRRR